MENMGYYEPDDCFICKNGRHLDYVSKYTSHTKDGTQSKKSLFTAVKTALIVLTVLFAARQKMRIEEKRFPSAGNFRRCASSLTGILPPKREGCFGATVPSRRKELSDNSSTTAASNAS